MPELAEVVVPLATRLPVFWSTAWIVIVCLGKHGVSYQRYGLREFAGGSTGRACHARQKRQAGSENEQGSKLIMARALCIAGSESNYRYCGIKKAWKSLPVREIKRGHAPASRRRHGRPAPVSAVQIRPPLPVNSITQLREVVPLLPWWTPLHFRAGENWSARPSSMRNTASTP